MLYQNKLFTESECDTIKSYVRTLKERSIGTHHPEVNNAKHDIVGGKMIADHIQWYISDEYKWFSDKILKWINELNLDRKISNLGWEFIVCKYVKGDFFKPHVDDVLADDNISIKKKRHFTIGIQLSNEIEYQGGKLYVENTPISQSKGTVYIFGNNQLHWVDEITEGSRWSCTIFLENDSLKKHLL